MAGFMFTLCAKPGQTGSAAASGLPLGHMAWRVGAGPSLLSHSVGQSMRGGAMVLSDAGFTETQRPDIAALEAFTRDIASEISQRGFTGLVCDFEQRRLHTLERLIEDLAPLLRRRNVALYVPERYAHCGGAKVLIPTAVTQGSLAGRLREAMERYGGAERLALDMECIALDITLPSPDNAGRSLSREELNALLRGRGGQSFLSAELCARYFTYRNADEHHFVLYDDGATLLKKAQTASRMGIFDGFVLYPEAEPFLGQLTMT